MAEKKPVSDPRQPEPTRDLPPLPTDPAARRRALRIRGW